jgi:hypothetical protein
MEKKQVVIDYRGYPLSIEYTFYPYRRGSLDGDGLQIEPDEPASIDITSIHHNGMEVYGMLTEQLPELEYEVKLQSGEFF